MDEAASRIRMEVESKPEEIENLDRRIIQLKIEEMALAKDRIRRPRIGWPPCARNWPMPSRSRPN
jgi:ATP-dependent Clp protease ATP-binding subunit ClpA